VFPRVFRFGLLLFVTPLFFGYFVQAFFVFVIGFSPFSFPAFPDFKFGLKALFVEAFFMFSFCEVCSTCATCWFDSCFPAMGRLCWRHTSSTCNGWHHGTAKRDE
jgi:hypothetical protein